MYRNHVTCGCPYPKSHNHHRRHGQFFGDSELKCREHKVARIGTGDEGAERPSSREEWPYGTHVARNPFRHS